MITSFCEQLATILQEVDVPVFIENLAYWIRKNAANEKHFHDGRYWSYNSYPAFAKLYPFWSEQKIRRIIKRAIEADLIIVDNFNRKKYDNTNWYTLTDKALAFYPALHGLILNTPVENDSTPVENDRPIPKPLTTSSNINITTSVSDETNNRKSISNQEILDAYHEHLPELTKIKVVDRDLGNKINSMKKNWHKYQKDGKSFTLELFVDFLRFVKAHHKWFLTPRVTESGNTRKNSLRNLIAEVNLARFANGEFSAN